MKSYLKFIIPLSISLIAGSCNRNFEEINTDNSRIKDPTSGSLLNPVLYSMSSYGYNRANDFTFDLMQVSIDFPNEGNIISRYYMTDKTGQGMWNTSYLWLKQVRDMMEIAKKEGDNNNLAIATILNAWIYANLTDSFGDIPMTEASQLDTGVQKPVFDQQKDVYLALLDQLNQANSMLDVKKKLVESDILYKGEAATDGIMKWKKFANSLSLRLLTRILAKNGEINVYERIRKIVSDPVNYPVFTSNADNAAIDISGIAPYLPPIARPQDFTTSRAAGEFFVNTLIDNNDPRIPFFLTKAKDLKNKDIGYKGAPAAYPLGTVFDYQPSQLSQNLAKAPMKLFMMTYSEVQFIMAEFSYKGIAAGNTKAYYENGVKAALEQWGTEMPVNYFSNQKVAFNNTFEQIMLQKYIALFFIDHQQWFEQRRTGLPKLPNNGGLQNEGKMPQRYMYTTQSRVLNPDNYKKAVQQMGGDDINVKVWWNK
ncbi:hypothetical protein BAX97_15605 [Elizabethkingia meningoseptica]|uniref:SusD/RagB family nutrient-binding outer membrane lipoprotein n=1 Tax=Elizabethkingia meningoseptica TaxID=238 RepID=UPI00099AE589|nr:SusD/RagB family nutrient-binding outer membrane lipoprotein [Elizabethkingia meningoseptica]OPC29256.1 hypothetical protein BAX97_15605 [Elizabethkingia meningoseptica]